MQLREQHSVYSKIELQKGIFIIHSVGRKNDIEKKLTLKLKKINPIKKNEIKKPQNLNLSVPKLQDRTLKKITHSPLSCSP